MFERGRWVDPSATGTNERNQPFIGDRCRHPLFDALLADVEVHLTGRAADVAEVGIGHLAGAIDDAAHDRNLDALEMAGLALNALRRLLQIEKRPAAGGAGDELGLREAHPCSLQQIEGQPSLGRIVEPARGAYELDGIAHSIAEH
jgi:hypothetical protein